MLSDLKDKRALVTGAAQGLGRAVAELFLERGARVVLTDIDGDLLEKTSADLGGAAYAVVCDVTSEDQVAASVRACVDTLGGLDVAVNNAGIEIAKPLVEQTEEEFDRLMAINVKGVFFGIKHQTPAMWPPAAGRS